MKNKNTNTNSAIGIASLVMSMISVASMIWIGGFQMSALIHDVKDIKEDINEIKVRLDKLEDGFDKMDIRVITLEQDHELQHKR